MNKAMWITKIAFLLSAFTYLHEQGDADSGNFSLTEYNGPETFLVFGAIMVAYLIFNIQTKIWTDMYGCDRISVPSTDYHFNLFWLWGICGALQITWNTGDVGDQATFSTGHGDYYLITFGITAALVFLFRTRYMLEKRIL